MVLGKRSRQSLSTSASSPALTLSTSTSSRHSTPACSSSTPASSVPPSPTPSCKRARTRTSDVGDFCDKENEAPPNWYVCGRPVDRDDEDASFSHNASNTESEDPDTRQPSARELRAQRRTSSRVVSTRSRPSLPGPSTPPVTPSHRRSSGITRHDTLGRTPSLHLSALSLDASTDSLEDGMDVDQPPVSSLHASPSLSKYARARALLRSGASLNPLQSVIAARANERSTIQNFITGYDFLSTQQSSSPEASIISSLYISGAPGTGKTALVLDILQQVQSEKSISSSNADDVSPCCIYVNCMGLADASSIWLRAREELIQSRGYKAGKLKAKSADARKSFEDVLTREKDLRCILVLDELDYVSKISSALSEVYQLSSRYPRVLRLIGISNTLTLGSSAPTGLPSPSSTPSKLFGPQQTLNFSAYNANDLLVILQARLQSLGQQDLREIINLIALNFLCKKVAAQNGDVRFAMSVLRKCLDSAEKGSTPERLGRVEMKHVLESLRAHESGTMSTPSVTAAAPAPSSSQLAQTTQPNSKGSGVSRTVRGLGLHARLALVAILVGWKRLEAGLPLSGPCLTSSFKSPSKSASRSPVKRSLSSTFSNSSPQSNELVTSSSLHTFYSHLLTSSYVTPDGNHEPATPFNPISRSEFQDVLGVLETCGLVGFSLSPPVISPVSSTSTSTQPSPTSIKAVLRTPSKPKRSTSFALPTPSRSARAKTMASTGESFVVLQEGVREDEIVRGLVTSTAPSGVQSAVDQGAVEREVQRLWERERRKIAKDTERRDMKISQEQEAMRLEREAIRDGVELGFDD